MENCLHEEFRAQAGRTPEAIAIKSRDRNPVSYKQLDQASDKLAAMLIRHGVGRDCSVGILMERCDEYALAYIAALKAGGAYLPLDPAYPEHLLTDVLGDSKPAVVVCKRNFVARLPESVTVVLLDENWDHCLNEIMEEDVVALGEVTKTDLDTLAYQVYSSGTTGKPKGIACPHRGAVFSYNWRFENIPYQADVTEVEGCNVFFVWEMMRPLLAGKTLCIIPDDVIYDPPLLATFVHDMQITRMLFTPSLLEAVLDCKTLDCSKLRSFNTLILCGEVVTVTLQERIKELLPWVRTWNLYSVSECHDVAAMELTTGEYGSRKYCPVGKLFVGVEAVVLDENLVQLPIGERGELYVAGPTLAREYIGLAQLTKERFPTIKGKRMYKTGDWARVLPNRELEILGRCDSMVKIRGYSVELRAIEAAIMALTDYVSSCCVTVQGEEGTDKFVVAYVVLKQGASCWKIRLDLKSKLPHYMIPAFLVELDELPTHEVSGKLNKKALPVVDIKTGNFAGRRRTVSTEFDCISPRNELERKLHDIWCKIMNTQQIDVVYDSFFDIGGHSLLAAQLVQAIKAELKLNVGVVDLFNHATIESLHQFFAGKETEGVTTQVDLLEEVETFDASKSLNDIAMRAFWRRTHFQSSRDRSVLITGATGFLGSYLCFELLNNTDIDVVYCIVRQGDVAPIGRVKAALTDRGLWKDEFECRLHCFAGDASLHHLGLEDDDYYALSTSVDVVIHCAALVNLVYPYKGLRAANVLGTRNMIEFAFMGKVKRFGYISTNGIFPDGLTDCAEDTDIDGFANQLTSGYSQSKWVAEKLVRRASDRGLPVVIFRPGNMGGDSGSRGGNKSWNTSDFNYLLITGSIKLGCAPDVPGWRMEMTPVDVAAQAITTILFDNDSLGEIFHVTNSAQCLEANKYFETVRAAGYPLARCSFEDWRSRVTDEKLKSAIVTTTAEFLSNLSTFSNEGFLKKCAQFDITIPRIGKTMMQTYMDTWHAQGVISVVVIPGQELIGKVAAVTGASSGIGAAIAQALAQAGARVALGGRRLERLQQLATEISRKTGTKVTAVKVDVTDRQQVKDFVKTAEGQLGPIDIFVNNAGVMHYTLMKNMYEDQWEKEVDVNCKGLLHGIGAVLPGMLERKRGHIVATSSDAGRKVFPGLSVYSGSKFFVEAVCQGLRLETADKGLRVTTIQPGDCKTELSGCTTDEEARAECSQPSNAREFWLDPCDVARAVVFAVTAPCHVGINEVLVEPRGAPA